MTFFIALGNFDAIFQYGSTDATGSVQFLGASKVETEIRRK